MRNLLFLISLIILTIVQTGCVGTIEDVSKVETNSNLATKTPLTFAGISDAVATAHNRVRVSFLPASGGSANFSYLVYVNGNFSLPIASISNSSAAVDSLGKYNVDVKNLQLNTAYTFSVRVYDVQNDQFDNNVIAISIRTLSEMVPIFDGIVGFDNLSGVDGLTKLQVSWNVATAAYEDPSGFGTNIHKIAGYNIYVGESATTMTLVGSLNDPAAKSFVLTSLVSGRSYYAMVRAKNSASPAVEDKNVTVLSKKTLVAKPIAFSGIKTISIPKTIEGFSNINLTWDAGTGTFDRYKIFVFNSAPGIVVPGTSTPQQTVVINDLSVTSASVTVALPNTTYYLVTVACAGDDCLSYDGASAVKSIKTTPPVAPFNGISSTTPLSLHSVKLNWSKPDITQGVYSQIKIFKSDASGNYNELTDEITGTPGTTGLVFDSITDTDATILDMPTGSEVCFVAMAYDNYYISTDYPFGRPSSLKVRSCVTLQYTSPGFLGINSSCTAVGATGFTVSWSTPSPLGIFDYYEMYVKEGNSGFSFADAIAGDASYRIVSPISKNDTSYVFTISSAAPLASDTYYQVGIKTYYNDGGTVRRDTNNAFTMNCKTAAVTAEMKGWNEIVAIGPKVNGLKAGINSGIISQAQIIPERIKPAVDVDGVVETRYLEYPQEYTSGSLGIDSSDQGMIKLVWNDFELTNGIGKLYDYSLSHPSTVVEYKVYRKEHAAKYDTAYKLKAKVDDSDWGLPINTAVINPQKRILPDNTAVYFGEFIDYGLVHPYMSGNPNQGKIYYYKVEAYMGGKKIAYQGTYSDAVVRVVLPPVNMAFAHRWMTNLQMCKDMGKTIDNNEVDRENDYKCLYNGMASTLDSTTNTRYADMKGDLLIDRFKMGCNFSRGGTTLACSDNANGYLNATTKLFFEGKTTDAAKGRLAGDCIGHGTTNGTSPNGIILSAPKAVFYDRGSRACYVNTSTTLDANGKGTTWKVLRDIESGELVPKNSSKILTEDGSFIGSPGWGKYVYSNNAYLPVLQFGTQNNLYRSCQSSRVDINSILFRKRLIRRKEEVATYVLPASLSDDNKNKMAGGTLFTRDCLSNVPPTLTIPNTASDLNLLLFNYPTLSNNANTNVQTVVNGSAGLNSTEACVSKFGLQDVSGNSNEFLSDRYYCSSTSLCSSGLKTVGAIGVAESTLTAPQIYTPEIDPANRANVMSGNGQHINFSTSAESNGLNIFNLTGNYSLARSTTTNYKYFNTVMGLPLGCLGSSCLLDGQNDDNTVVTSLSSATGTVATILSFNYSGYQTTASYSGTLPGTILPITLNGGSNENLANGRHSFVIRSYFDGNYAYITSGRCTTLIENYIDQSVQYND